MAEQDLPDLGTAFACMRSRIAKGPHKLRPSSEQLPRATDYFPENSNRRLA
jgi:hypothetical protein